MKTQLIAGIIGSLFAAAAACAAPVTTEGTGIGKHGDVTVAVTFDEGRIQDIKLVKEQENPVLARKVYSDLKNLVIETNSTDLDVISGATFSSKGLLDAVADAAILPAEVLRVEDHHAALVHVAVLATTITPVTPRSSRFTAWNAPPPK